MKKFTFKGVLDGFRSSTVQQPPRGAEQEIQETLRADHFQLKKTFRHGFPFSPTAVAWDPIQKLLAIGDKSGSLRILGRPGVDAHVRHESTGIGGSEAVLHIQFLVNEGALVTATADDVLHLWNFRQKSPQVVQSLKFQRERITCIHLPLQSKWLHVGTERGNVYAVHIETFVLSAYVINWNKAIEPSRSTHPGPVVQITDNPLDASKLLIAFESGQMVVWDLRSKCADYRCIGAESLRSIAWHQEGKQFMSSHGDGSLATWAVRGPPKPLVVSYPHAKANKDGKMETCKTIQKVEWKTNKAGETLVIFSGGLPADKTGKTPSITVINGKSTTVLEIEHSVVDFITLCESPWTGDYQDPFAIVVLLQNDLVVIDLLTQGYPCFENPYPMDIHESPVTCCSYLADCPSDLIPAFYSVGRQCSQKKAGFSEREWPINGGEWSPASCSYNEIILTGHADGSVKFWDASAGTLQILYKLKTSKVFERRPNSGVDTSMDDSPLAIQLMSLCAESRRLAVACTASHVTLFKFRKADTTSETHVLDVPVISQDDSENSPDSEYPPTSRGSISSRAMGCQDSVDSQDRRYLGPGGDLRVRGAQGTGGVRKAAGFQAALVCLQQSPASAGNISALTINSSYGLMAYGGERGIIVVDISRRVIVTSLSPAALYGGADPFGRTGTIGGSGGATGGPPSGGGMRRDTDASQHQRSPSIDQLEEALGELTGVSEPSPVPLSSGCQTASVSQEITPTNQDANLEIADEAYLSLTPKADVTNAITIPQRDMSSHSPQHVGSLPTSGLFANDSLSLSSDERSKMEAAQNRRKSTTWKGIRRQLSRVDIKFKTPFSVAPEKKDPDGKDANKKTSVFYYSNSDVAPSSPTETESINNRAKEMTQDKVVTEIATPSSELDKLSKTCDASLEEIDKVTELPDKPKLDPYDRMHQELKEVWKEDLLDSKPSSDSEQPSCSPSRSELKKDRRVTISVLDGTSISRPDNLPLFDDEGRPIRPPRQQRKNKNSQPDKRDQRLLSVPNINTKQENVLKDLRKKETSSQLQTSFAANIMQRFNKLDSSFSRSRSSSMSSLENISSEAIQCLAFADSYTKKTDPTLLLPTLWIGTSLGSVLTMMINLPDADSRYTQPVVVSVSGGPIFRLKGSILTMSFLDCNGALIPYSYESWKDENKETRDRRERTPTKQSSSSRMSPTLSGEGSAGQSTASVGYSDRQFVVIASEKQARVVALPSQNCVYRQQIADADFVVKAEIVSLKDSVCLVNYVSTGHLIAYSLPSLRPLIDVDFLPLAELRIARTFCFSNRGHGLYLSSSTELQKFTIDVEFCQSLGEMMGELFLPRDMPEPPKESFFQSLFGGGSRPLDREELFGEAIGKPPKSIAKHVGPGNPAAMEQLGTRASTASSEIQRAHQMVMERGDKLSQLEDRTERMHSQAQEFGSSAHQLMLKYKDKKWYQL